VRVSRRRRVVVLAAVGAVLTGATAAGAPETAPVSEAVQVCPNPQSGCSASNHNAVLL